MTKIAVPAYPDHIIENNLVLSGLHPEKLHSCIHALGMWDDCMDAEGRATQEAKAETVLQDSEDS